MTEHGDKFAAFYFESNVLYGVRLFFGIGKTYAVEFNCDVGERFYLFRFFDTVVGFYLALFHTAP